MEFTPVYDSKKLRDLASKQQKEGKKLFQKLRKTRPKDLDSFVSNVHEKVFQKVDCLECANCCRGLGPRVSEMDIRRLSKFLKIKTTEFIDTYLRIDEDNDYVFKDMPCPFLMKNNHCFVYEYRPKACRDYPHTDRKKYFQILHLGLRNAETCPAVLQINQEIINRYK
jgi:Fe-S-cluster containining protein